MLYYSYPAIRKIKNKDDDMFSFLQQYGIETEQPWWA